MSAHNIELTQAQRAKLERYRDTWRLKSLTDAIRHMIEHNADEEPSVGLLRGLRAPTEERA